jgi:hypothetical protein
MSRYQIIYLLVLAFGIASIAGGSPGEVEVATPGTLVSKYFIVKLKQKIHLGTGTCLFKICGSNNSHRQELGTLNW